VKVTKPALFWTGIGILVVLGLFYFVKLDVDSGENYIVQDSLLGIIIFHKAFILSFYVVIAAILMAAGIKFNNNKMKGGKKNE